MNCERCSEPIEPRTYRGGTPKRFCSCRCRRIEQRKRYQTNHPEKHRERQSRYNKSEKGKRANYNKRQHPDFQRKRCARDAVRRAIIAGELVRPSTCRNCGSTGRIEAHHYKGYDLALDVDNQLGD